jgi:hypothetical protein
MDELVSDARAILCNHQPLNLARPGVECRWHQIIEARTCVWSGFVGVIEEFPWLPTRSSQQEGISQESSFFIEGSSKVESKQASHLKLDRLESETA